MRPAGLLRNVLVVWRAPDKRPKCWLSTVTFPHHLCLFSRGWKSPESGTSIEPAMGFWAAASRTDGTYPIFIFFGGLL